MSKITNLPVELIEDEFWDYYSGLPNPMWYQRVIQTQDEEEITSSNADTTITDR